MAFFVFGETAASLSTNICSIVNGTKPLSYNITGGSARQKKCPQKHGGFSRHMTPFPWQLVPPTYGITAEQAQFWARYKFHTPLVLSKIFLLFEIFAVNSRFYFYYFDLAFDQLFKDLKVVHAILTRERQQTNMKTLRNLGKCDILWQS